MTVKGKPGEAFTLLRSIADDEERLTESSAVFCGAMMINLNVTFWYCGGFGIWNLRIREKARSKSCCCDCDDGGYSFLPSHQPKEKHILLYNNSNNKKKQQLQHHHGVFAKPRCHVYAVSSALQCWKFECSSGRQSRDGDAQNTAHECI